MKTRIIAAMLLLSLGGCRSAREAQMSTEVQAESETRTSRRVEIRREELHNIIGEAAIELDSVKIHIAGNRTVEARRARIVSQTTREIAVSERGTGGDSVWHMSVSRERKENIEKTVTKIAPQLIIIIAGVCASLAALMFWKRR